MHYAIDEFRNRIAPSPGKKGWCPLCNSGMIAKCGQINIWHWQHFGERFCDDWLENETEWHRKWKEHFPLECREVIIEENGELHIADVKTAHGTVIEFQNSSISSTTITIRENFYENMVWIVNAMHFQERFTIRSIVKRKLREIDIAYESDCENNEAHDLPNFSETIRKLDLYIEEEENKIAKAMTYLEKLDDIKGKLNLAIEDILKSLEKGTSSPSFSMHGLDTIVASVKRIYDNHNSEIVHLNEKIRKENYELEWINRFERFDYEDTSYIIVPVKMLTGNTYFKTIALQKGQRDTLFPVVLKFRRETDFLSLKHKGDNYEFGIDPSDRIKRVEGAIGNLEERLERLINNSPDFCDLLSKRIDDFLIAEVEKVNGDINSHAERSLDYFTKKINLEIENENYIEEQEMELLRWSKQREAEWKASRNSVMSKFKGLYSFNWKNERKSWEYAECPVFFDMGGDYLFKRIGTNKLEKISKSVFLNSHVT